MKAIFAFCYHKKTDLLATIAALYAAIVVIPARFDTTELEQLLRHEFEAHTQILDETLTEKYPIVLALETRSSHSYQKANFGEIVSKNTSMNDYIDSLLAKIAHDEPIYNTDLHRATTLFDSLNHAILQYIEPRDSAITAQIYEVPIAYSTYNLTNEQIKDILWVLKLQSIEKTAFIGNYGISKQWGLDVVLKPNPTVMIVPKRCSYKIGDTMEGKVVMGTFYPARNTTVFVNKEPQVFKNGTVFYHEKPTRIGEHRLDIIATVRNPATNVLITVRDTFCYEVIP